MTSRCALQKCSQALLALAAAFLPNLGLGQQLDAEDGQPVLNSQVWRAFVTIVERDFEAPVVGATLDALCLKLVRLRSEKALSTTASDCVREVAFAIDSEANFTPAAERLPLATANGSRFGSFALELRRKQSGEPLFIESTIHGGPGARAGLMAGDAIVAVDGESLRSLSIEDCVRRLRGTPGTSATLRILRNGSEFEIQMVREVIRIQYVRAQFLEGGIAHVRISAFIKETTAPQLAAAISRVWKTSPSPVKGLILDVRGNFGGDLKEVFEVASLLTEPGTKLLTSALRSGIESFTSVPRPNRPVLANPVAQFLERAPLVVLVNSKTTSGAEALAFVLRRERNAQTIGERTAGVVSVRQVRELPDGSTVQLTIGRLLSPVGRNWSIDGVEIDQVVPDLPGYEYGQLPNDIVLLEAIKTIRRKL